MKPRDFNKEFEASWAHLPVEGRKLIKILFVESRRLDDPRFIREPDPDKLREQLLVMSEEFRRRYWDYLTDVQKQRLNIFFHCFRKPGEPGEPVIKIEYY
jgi:hypothetical protein